MVLLPPCALQHYWSNGRLFPRPYSEVASHATEDAFRSGDQIAGYTQLIERAHAAGLKIILGTIPPAEGAVTDGLPVIGDLPVGIDVMHGTPKARRSRDAVNAWIREQQLGDGVVDFDACLEDPDRPGHLAAGYNSGDNLHPSPAGYAAMALCVDLDLFRTPGNRP